MSEFGDGVRAVGRALGAAGAYVGGSIADGYRAIDPDVTRHVLQIPLLGYSLIGAREATIEALPDDGHPPLVFVHGLGGSRGDFLLMARYLAFLGRRRSYRIHFDADHGVAERAAALAATVRRVLAVNDAARVDIVAHSLGGVVARLVLLDYGLEDRVRTLVTLGAPLAGTYPARYGNTPILRDLRPDSALMTRLRGAPWPTAVRGVSFWSRNDLFVLPPESAAAEGTEQIDATPATHYSYLVHPRSWDAVADALEL